MEDWAFSSRYSMFSSDGYVLFHKLRSEESSEEEVPFKKLSKITVKIPLPNGKKMKIVSERPPFSKGTLCPKCNELSVNWRGLCENCCNATGCFKIRTKINGIWICPDGHCEWQFSWCANKTVKRNVYGMCYSCYKFSKNECIGYNDV